MATHYATPMQEVGKARVKTHANPPDHCDLCQSEIEDEFYDFRDPRMGMWGNGCPTCFSIAGGKLGTGLGQHYKMLAPGVRVFTKVGGFVLVELILAIMIIGAFAIAGFVVWMQYQERQERQAYIDRCIAMGGLPSPAYQEQVSCTLPAKKPE